MAVKKEQHNISVDGRVWTSTVWPCSVDLETVAGVFSNQYESSEGGWPYTIVFKSGATTECWGTGLKTAFHDWQLRRQKVLAIEGFSDAVESLT